MAGTATRAALGAILGIMLIGAPPAASASESIMRIGLPTQISPRYMDPLEATNNTYYGVLYAVHDALIKGMDGGTKPGLAESVTHNSQFTEYTYRIRENAKFHNGAKVTAEDVVFSLESYRGADAALLKSRIKSIEATDERTVVVTLHAPWPDFLAFTSTTATAFGWIVPKAYYQQVGPEGFIKAPIGAGPYKVESIGVRDVTLKRFDAFSGRKAKVETLVLSGSTDTAQALAQLRTGGLDFVSNVTGELAEAAAKVPGVTVFNKQAHVVFFLKFFDQGDPNSPWSKKEVRQAVNLALDRAMLSEIETNGVSVPTGTIVPPWFEGAWKAPVPEKDLEKARALMKQAGYPDGFTTKFAPLPPYFRMGEAVAAMLAEIGIKVEIEKMERAVFYDRLASKNLKGVCLCAHGVGGNASIRIGREIYGKGVFSYTANPAIDALYEKQEKETDVEARKALLVDLQKLIQEEAYDAPIYFYAIPMAYGPRVKVAPMLVDGHAYIAPYELLELKN